MSIYSATIIGNVETNLVVIAAAETRGSHRVVVRIISDDEDTLAECEVRLDDLLSALESVGIIEAEKSASGSFEKGSEEFLVGILSDPSFRESAKARIKAFISKNVPGPRKDDEFCANCRFWEAVNDTGECRRFPPTFLPVHRYRMQEPVKGDQVVAPEDQSCYPTADSGSWCGEFLSAESNPASGTVLEEVKRQERESRNGDDE